VPFTYNFSTAPAIAYVRLLIADTDSLKPIFNDDEINAFLFLTSSQNIYVSSMAAPSGVVGPVPLQVYSYYRAAAVALDTLAGLRARLASVIQILDVKLDPGKAAQYLRAQAEAFREMDDNLGHFAIAEQINNQFQARERVWKMFLRIEGS
jgi:hypothetical protein